mgnify:FL=1|jgi:hypothetical protein
MTKTITTVLTALLLTAGSANAFFDNANYMPWDNNNNERWSFNSDAEDNGIFAYNSYDLWDPRWYSTEFTNMVNEIDDEQTNQYAFNSNSFPAKDTTAVTIITK